MGTALSVVAVYYNAASSFWPCQINYLKAYLKAIFGANIGFSIVSQMSETDDETLKAEIDEIMSRVDTIMDKVARIIPEDKEETDGRE
jgi:hypothetical protein